MQEIKRRFSPVLEVVSNQRFSRKPKFKKLEVLKLSSSQTTASEKTTNVLHKQSSCNSYIMAKQLHQQSIYNVQER